MKKIIVIILVLFSVESQAQVLQKNTSYGWSWLRGSFDSVLQIPKDTARGGKRIFETGKDTGQLRYMVGDSSVYVHTGRKWIKVGGSGGGGTPSFQDVLNVSRFLSSSQVISATDTFRINIAKNYWKLADSLLIYGMKRQDGAEHYIQMVPAGITTAVQNSSTSQAEQQFTFANGASKGTLRFRTTDLIYESPDSSNVNANNVLWVDMADGEKIKKGFLSSGGGGLTYADTGRGQTKIATGGSLNKVRDSVQTNIDLKLSISDTAAMMKRDTSSVYLISNATTSSTTAVGTGLRFQIGANQTFIVMIDGTASKATTNTGLQLAIGAPSGCTIKGYAQQGTATLSTAMTNSLITAINTLGNTFATGIGVEVPFRQVFTVTNGANAGTIELQFATVTSNVATIFAGTNMRWQRTKGL
jgi:hypothetical protein